MESASQNGEKVSLQSKVDWMDIAFVVIVGLVAALLKIVGAVHPDWHFSMHTENAVASLLVAGYITTRARREPEKLDEWGLTTRLTFPAVIMGLLLIGLAVGFRVLESMAVGGRVVVEPFLIPQALEYTLGAFPQQFAMCSVGVVTLCKVRLFQGYWRLPIVVGIVFCLAHVWTPDRIPGTIIPIQFIHTLPGGVLATLYFLKFRNILPLIAVPALMWPLGLNWVYNSL